MVAVLQTITNGGTVKEIATCSGKGELYWPYIRLEPLSAKLNLKSMSQADMSTSGFTKEKEKGEYFSQIQPGDAYVQLECSLGGDTEAAAKRDDTRDMRFAAAVKSWEANEPGRNAKGALIR
ncbi:unnamed protein product, partial [Iphiclides podalirius]